MNFFFFDQANFLTSLLGVSDVYQSFVTTFLAAVNSVAPIKTLRVKYQTKLRFAVNAVWNRDKHWRKFKLSGKEIGKHNFEFVKFLLEKICNTSEKIYFGKKCRTLAKHKVLGMPSKGKK